jgi:hypothetical protein
VRHGFHFRERGRFCLFPHRACVARVPHPRLLVLALIGRLRPVDLGAAIGDRMAA